MTLHNLMKSSNTSHTSKYDLFYYFISDIHGRDPENSEMLNIQCYITEGHFMLHERLILCNMIVFIKISGYSLYVSLVLHCGVCRRHYEA